MSNQAKYKNGTTTQTIVTGNGTLYGIIINSHSSGTLKLYDNTAASGTVIMNTFSFPSGSQIYMFPMGISFYTGLHAVKGGTIDYTFLTKEN